MHSNVLALRSVAGIGAAAFAIVLVVCSGSRLGAQDAKSAAAQLAELQKQAAAGDAPAMFALSATDMAREPRSTFPRRPNGMARRPKRIMPRQ